MKRKERIFHLKVYVLLVLVGLFVGACVDGGNSRRIVRDGISGIGPGSEGDGAGNTGSGTGDVAAVTTGVEIRHLIDPFDGSFKTKLTLPKNYKGLFYISGLNISSLNPELIHVRFRFGRDLEPIDIPATIRVGAGLTQTAQVSVLTLDLGDTPFRNIALPYDLYDYNDYAEGEAPDLNADGVPDNRNNKLFCRGLDLQYDPTFEGSSASCSASGDKCLYGYAKIRDSGLYKNEGGVWVSQVPTEPNIGINGPLNSDSAAVKLKKCLPENGTVTFDNAATKSLLTTGASSATPTASPGNAVHTVSGVDYNYIGPYLAINVSEWAIGTTAAIHDHILEADANKKTPRGLFMRSQNNTNDVATGYYSYLFPRFGQLKLKADTQYIGANKGTGGLTTNVPPDHYINYNVTANRILDTLLSDGTTNYMDGCNIRATNYNEDTGEGIGSCNITATIELITIDQLTNAATVISSNKELKLQLVRPSEKDTEGNEVLVQSMSSCSSNAACGADSCCFNNRCVSNQLVSACLNDSNNQGHTPIGNSCESDFDCSSLCCDSTTGKCKAHDNTGPEPALCSKSPGQFCVSKEWCRQDIVTKWYIINTGVDPTTGQPTCDLRQYPVLTNGDCVFGTCVSPSAEARPSFDPSAPNACDNAVAPPTF
jgi:hypothetical protein